VGIWPYNYVPREEVRSNLGRLQDPNHFHFAFQLVIQCWLPLLTQQRHDKVRDIFWLSVAVRHRHYVLYSTTYKGYFWCYTLAVQGLKRVGRWQTSKSSDKVWIRVGSKFETDNGWVHPHEFHFWFSSLCARTTYRRESAMALLV
jgi:hypothetical protein